MNTKSNNTKALNRAAKEMKKANTTMKKANKIDGKIKLILEYVE